MLIVILTALGVGGATVIGSLIGFICKGISHKLSDIAMSFAAGIMMAASVVGLILPSLEGGGIIDIVVTVAGIFVGALCIDLIGKFVPHMRRFLEPQAECEDESSLDKAMLFIAAMAIHNLPEGIAAGVGFGSGDISQALFIAGGIALQNIPDGMVIIAPMLSAGISPKRTFFCAMLTGAFEVIGTLIGYFAASLSAAILPFALSFAGGAMLYIISDEIIPETHADGHQRGATYALLIGFCLMLITNQLL